MALIFILEKGKYLALEWNGMECIKLMQPFTPVQ